MFGELENSPNHSDYDTFKTIANKFISHFPVAFSISDSFQLCNYRFCRKITFFFRTFDVFSRLIIDTFCYNFLRLVLKAFFTFILAEIL
jgi:hypothetical protein